MKAHGIGAVPEILIIEDDPQMQVLLSDNLEFEGYAPTAVTTAEEALATLTSAHWSLIIVDVMLPRASGYEFCRQARAGGLVTPIMILTARGEETDRVLGLDLGADDYIIKPFSVRELLARVRAQLRRGGSQTTDISGDVIVGDVRINVRKREVTRRGRRVKLSAREFELLRYLLAHSGEVVSREQLLRDVWGYQDLTVTRTVDNFIAKLRAQLERTPHDPHHIITVHGAGYQFLV